MRRLIELQRSIQVEHLVVQANRYALEAFGQRDMNAFGVVLRASGSRFAAPTRQRILEPELHEQPREVRGQPRAHVQPLLAARVAKPQLPRVQRESMKVEALAEDAVVL
ncbi:MAG: hypothetical protein RL701_3446, partial [Pseudomonadota bacterium]